MATEHENKITTGVAIVITMVWTASFVADLFIMGYEPPPSVMPLMLATAGYLFGKGALGGNGKNRHPGDKEATKEAET